MATDETQARIIEAAGPIFAEKGYRDATVREICEAANVGSASINYHFRDKQHLYVLVVERAYEEMQCSHPPRLDDVPDMPAPQRLAEWILRLTRKILRDGRETWQDRIISREFIDPTPPCEDFMRQRVQADMKPFFEVLEQTLPKPVSDAARWRFAFSVLGQVLLYDSHRQFFRVLVGETADTPEFTADKIAEHVTHVCAAALGLLPPFSESETGA